MGGVSIRTQDESGIYDVTGLREYAASFAVCECYINLDNRRERVAATDSSPQPRAGADKLKSELAAAWADVSHALRGFYELADFLIVLDEVVLLEISNIARQLKFNPEIRDIHPILSHLTVSMWFRSMDLTITSSTSKARGPAMKGRMRPRPKNSWNQWHTA